MREFGPLSLQNGWREIGVTQELRAEIVGLLPRLRRFAYGLTGSLDDGDDLVQSACERALTRLDQFQPGTRLDSWMYRIVQNLWIDQRRARQARPEAGMDPVDLEALAVRDAERELNSRLALATVQRAVGKLSEDQRAVLLLVCVEGQSYKAAAEVLEIPLGTVMSRLARARLAVGRALDGAQGATASQTKG
jgi:RNA polymerase sigma-70 factor, ECF subfamily